MLDVQHDIQKLIQELQYACKALQTQNTELQKQNAFLLRRIMQCDEREDALLAERAELLNKNAALIRQLYPAKKEIMEVKITCP